LFQRFPNEKNFKASMFYFHTKTFCARRVSIFPHFLFLKRLWNNFLREKESACCVDVKVNVAQCLCTTQICSIIKQETQNSYINTNLQAITTIARRWREKGREKKRKKEGPKFIGVEMFVGCVICATVTTAIQ
jgi:hypothetical protein